MYVVVKGMFEVVFDGFQVIDFLGGNLLYGSLGVGGRENVGLVGIVWLVQYIVWVWLYVVFFVECLDLFFLEIDYGVLLYSGFFFGICLVFFIGFVGCLAWVFFLLFFGIDDELFVFWIIVCNDFGQDINFGY